jgi:hypothetical protein
VNVGRAIVAAEPNDGVIGNAKAAEFSAKSAHFLVHSRETTEPVLTLDGFFRVKRTHFVAGSDGSVHSVEPDGGEEGFLFCSTFLDELECSTHQNFRVFPGEIFINELTRSSPVIFTKTKTDHRTVLDGFIHDKLISGCTKLWAIVVIGVISR